MFIFYFKYASFIFNNRPTTNISFIVISAIDLSYNILFNLSCEYES